MQEGACLPQSQLPILFAASFSHHPITVPNPHAPHLPAASPPLPVQNHIKLRWAFPIANNFEVAFLYQKNCRMSKPDIHCRVLLVRLQHGSTSLQIHCKAALKAVGTQRRAAREVDGISDAPSVELLAASPGIPNSWLSLTSWAEHQPSPSQDLTEIWISVGFPQPLQKPAFLVLSCFVCPAVQSVLQPHAAGLQPARPLWQRRLPLPHDGCGSCSEVRNHVGGEMGRVHHFMSLSKVGQGSKGGTWEWGSESFPLTQLLWGRDKVCPWLLWLYKICAWSNLRGPESEEREKQRRKCLVTSFELWEMRKCAGQECNALGGAEAGECKTALFLIKEPVQKWFMEVDPPLMLWADYKAMPHQFPRFLDRESWSHTLEDSPQCAKSSQLCILKSPLSFSLAPLPLLCLHSSKALHFTGEKKSFF